jgi:transcriptional regulator GlxA family with amidase domain
MDLLEQHYSERFTREDLAKSCGQSATSVNRHFRRLLRTTPTIYQLALRVEAARRVLVASDAESSRIALKCGFADQSHFTRRFREVTGITPLQYRSQFRDTSQPNHQSKYA